MRKPFWLGTCRAIQSIKIGCGTAWSRSFGDVKFFEPGIWRDLAHLFPTDGMSACSIRRIRFEQPGHEATKKSLLFGRFVVNSIP